MLVGVATLCGCPDDPATTGTGSGGGGGTGVGGEGGYAEGPPASPKSIVRFKTGKRMQQELSRALEIEPGLLCQELGKLDCFGIHQVVLGSPDAFFAGIYESLPDTTATTPLAVDRVVLAACSKRAEKDLAPTSPGLIFKRLPTADNKITDIDSQAVTDAIQTLYQRALGRDAKEAEVAHHRQLYADLEAVGSDTLSRDWATLSCFSVFTTMEALFY
jgi:hypothetical protein